MSKLIEADVDKTLQQLTQVESGIRRAPYRTADAFGAYLQGRTAETFAALAFGGTYRGVFWPSRQRNRTADRGRPLLVKSGRLKSAATAAAAKVGADRLEFSVDVPYARAVAARRPFLFFESGIDARRLSQLVLVGCGLEEGN